MATKKVNIDIVAKDKSKQALKGVRGNLDSVKKSVFNLRNAFIGLGAGLAIRSIVNTGKEIEGLQVRLKFLFGTAEEGAKAFDEMAKFAGKVPFSLAEIQRGAGVLAVVSKDSKELANIMKITGNVAAVTGLDFKTTAEQIQRSLSAGISAADLFRDRGVKAMLGFKAGAKVSVEETVEAFERVFGSGGKFDGATDQLAQTFEGTLSMIGDKIFNFKRTILEAGFFPELKKQFKDLDNFLANQSDALDKMAIKIGKGLAIAVKNLADAIIFVKENVDLFAGALGTLIALKVAGFFYGAATALAGLTAGMKAFNFATKKNIIFGSVMVFASAMGFLIAKFKEFKGELSTEFDNKSIKELNDELDLITENIKKYKKEGASGLDDLARAYQNQAILIALIAEKTKELNIENGFHIQQMRDSLKLVNANTDALAARNEALEEFLDKEKQLKMMQEDSSLFDNPFDQSQKEKQAFETSIANYKLFAHTMNRLRKNNEDEYWKSYTEAMSKRHRAEQELTKINEEKKIALKKEASDQIFENTKDTLRALSGLNRTAFEAFKRLQIAEAVINAVGSASKAMNSGYPPPLNFILAGTALAKGMAMVAQIQATSYRQQGGMVKAGQPYMVGEAGKELFVPNQSGKIVPNHELGQPVNVNFNITTVDASGFNQLLNNSRGTIVNMINSAVNETGRQAIV
tara:strand:+ start:3091 stop:5157 length:2067 start_codon:yes stop_codon:yes gene_type:complete